MVLKLGDFGKCIRNIWKVLKGAVDCSISSVGTSV
jgi:hypothetical protein